MLPLSAQAAPRRAEPQSSGPVRTAARKRQEIEMKKLLFAASAAALAAAMAPAAIGSVQAAPAKSPYCKMAAGQKNLVAWNAYYHCLGEAPRPAHVAVRARPEPAKDPMCKLAAGQKNLVSWNAYYHCINAAPRASAPPRRLYAYAGPLQSKDPYCKLASGQKNLVSWNAYYHCLSH
jgi:hypothetical protein